MKVPFQNFLKDINKAGHRLKEINEPALVISHYDADGISSASIITKVLSDIGIFYQLKIVEQLTPELLDHVFSLSYKNVFLLDMGSGVKRPSIKGKNIFILDHHTPEDGSSLEGEDSCVYEINPYFYGIDGSTEISSSGIAYFLAKSISEEYVFLSSIALVGALGDRQDVGERFSLKGLNRIIVEEAKRYNLVEEKIGLRLFGPLDRPLVKALAYTFDPFIPGITGDEGGSLNFLKKLGIEISTGDKLRSLKDLSNEEMRKLATGLIKYIISMGLSVSEAERIFGTNYYMVGKDVKSPLRDLREFSYVLNACGRMERHEIGIALCTQHSERYIRMAVDLVKEYRKVISETIGFIRREWNNVLRKFGNLAYIFLGDRISDKIVGAIASLLASSKIGDEPYKVVCVGVKSRYGLIKLSLRKVIEDENIHLGKILSNLSKKYGKSGGGHKDAGGILVNPDHIEKFFEELKKYII
ncbi:MAG TPA: DHH family phosphoesterase [Thermofilum sp.]|nr:DHH family phosphoesterase [Thermofilum sp.]